MRKETYNNEHEWLDSRRARITGSKLKNVAGSMKATKSEIKDELEERDIDYDDSAYKAELKEKLPPSARAKFRMKGDKNLAYYEVLAEYVALPESDEPAIDRGTRLETKAIERFEEETDLEVNHELQVWVADDNDHIAVSPDGEVVDELSATEIKCPTSKHFLKAYLEQEIPARYKPQVYQYFIVNDELEKLYFVFYDPRMPLDLFYFEVERDEVQDRLDEYRRVEELIVEDMHEIENQLTYE